MSEPTGFRVVYNFGEMEAPTHLLASPDRTACSIHSHGLMVDAPDADPAEVSCPACRAYYEAGETRLVTKLVGMRGQE